MKKLYLILILVMVGNAIQPSISNAQKFTALEKVRWEKQANQVTIIRDEWGIPHIYGKTDADAVFGLMYAQCEENFEQIELNYLEMLGRTAEIKGANAIYDDLMMRLIQDSSDAIKDFNNAPAWFKALLVAHADGLNYYLYKHPEVKPKVINYFKPWYHLMWTDGSVSPTRTGGIKVKDVKQFYGVNKNVVSISEDITTSQLDENDLSPYDMEEKTLKGSNGFAIAPKHSKNGTALLYINPHVPFYFRSEMHMSSEQGLNVYGAVTWGQMFIYQGFNEHCGWMHTTGYADVADVFEEKVSKKNEAWFYELDKKTIPLQKKQIPVSYLENGERRTKNFTTYASGHGPIMGSREDKWLSLKENNRSLNALIECWT
jgi:acyl-homoserine lactone acylase PvdQ